jgi:hypothetical protein
MSRRARLMTGAFVAALLLAGAVGTATANRLRFSNQSFRIVWSTLTFFEPNAPMTPIVVRCPVTMEGSFHSATISKMRNALIGYITKAITAPEMCFGEQDPRLFIRNGTQIFLDGNTYESLPWHVQYESFSGTLPTITGVRVGIVGMAFLILDIFHQCLFMSTAANPAYGIFQREANGAITGFRAEEMTAIPLKEALNGRPCPMSIKWFETGTVTLLGATTRITLTLVQ